MYSAAPPSSGLGFWSAILKAGTAIATTVGPLYLQNKMQKDALRAQLQQQQTAQAAAQVPPTGAGAYPLYPIQQQQLISGVSNTVVIGAGVLIAVLVLTRR